MAIGLDVGGTKCLAVRIGDSGQVEEQREAATPGTTAELAELAARMIRSLGPEPEVGIGVPAPVSDAGKVGHLTNLPLVSADELRERLTAMVGCRARFGNDVACAVLGEWRLGSGRGLTDLVMVALGTGVGAGVVLGGRLQSGATGALGELGHVPLDPNGPLCGCGQRGCWETLVSGSALDRAAVLHLGPGHRGADLVAARGTAPAIDAVLDGYVRDLSRGLRMVSAVYDPQLILIGGGVMHSSEAILPYVGKALDDSPATYRDGWPPIGIGVLGSRAGAIGAAILPRLSP